MGKSTDKTTVKRKSQDDEVKGQTAKKAKQATPKATAKTPTTVKSKTQPKTKSKTTTPKKSEPKKQVKDGKTSSSTTQKGTSKETAKRGGGTEQDIREREGYTVPQPTKNKQGNLVFEDSSLIYPNMTPKEVLQAGSFGGTYFRPIKSSVTGESHSGVWKELPSDWLEGLNIGRQISSTTYHTDVNTYGVKCGGSLEMWESSGWIDKQDPYGWFQWYCRYYLGRRTADDDRQISRWAKCTGVKGRWRNNLISKCVRSGCAFDNHAVSPVVRQTLQHWGYRLTEADFKKYAKKVKL